MKELIIAHLYPAEMNIYGDMGNIICLKKRAQWRGITVRYEQVNVKDSYDFTQADIVFGGGGQDKGQILIADDLQRHKDNIEQAVKENVVFLTICGVYQLFGHHFITAGGETLPGIGVFNMKTIASKNRMIGNAIITSQFGELVGFENHSGQTWLAKDQAALGRVKKGFGNNGQDGFEGAIRQNAIGSYFHGPLLPKNPHLADELIKRALSRKYKDIKLEQIDDSLAIKAAAVASSRPQ